MPQHYPDALEQARRLFTVLLVILASKDDSEELHSTKAAVFETIKSSKARNREEHGSHIRSSIIFMANYVYDKNGFNSLTVTSWISEIKKRGTMYGLLELSP